MASITPVKDGYRAQVYVNGKRSSKTLPTKREAMNWAAARETELRDVAGGKGTKNTLHQALDKYADEVSPGRRGERWEIIRLDAIKRQLIDVRLANLTPADLATWRDKRLKAVKSSSVLRDISLLSAVLEAAKTDWEWIKVNPMREIRKPSPPQHRNRTIAWSEIRGMLRALGHARRPRTVSQAVALAFCLALRTGMRAGELCGLPWAAVKGDHLVLEMTKNGTRREVPLSAKAQLLMERARGIDTDSVFALKTQTLDALFRKARDRAGLAGFTFHDSRHTAATWISGKLDVLDLCKMFGWSDPKQAMVYYNPKVSAIARRL